MNWSAIVPLKGRGERKTRLASRLDVARRRELTDHLFAHVVAVLRGCDPSIDPILLSDQAPEEWSGPFLHDRGRGLNAELEAAVASLGGGPLLVIHADLPLVTTGEITNLLSAASGGCAIAPDRGRSGTNAIALVDPAGFPFAFGAGSFGRHCVAAGEDARIVDRMGLALDIDAPADLDDAVRLGATLPASVR